MKKMFCLFLLLLCTRIFAANAPLLCNGKPVLGAIETVSLLDQHLMLDAKLDTGADMSSLSATDMHFFKKDDKEWVRFTLNGGMQKKITLTKPVLRYVHILKHTEEVRYPSQSNEKQYSKRAVVQFLICIGEEKQNILVNLIDRTQFKYPMLIGDVTLRKFRVVIDVGQTHLSVPHCT